MKRYGSSNNLADDFGYSYFSGTNRLQTIGEGLTTYSYTYDNNGNMISDQLNRTGSIKYDHRNLMTEIRVIKSEAPSIFDPPVDVLYLTQYRYDEAGNRVRKTRWKYTGSTPDPVFDMSGDAPPWTLQSDEFYIRDVSGKEIAIYSGNSLTQWNIWGLDNVGKINADTTRNYYLKDHLGSVRVVLNSTNGIVSAQDYDAWGYPLENRTYNASAMKYDFTGKERDEESSYDYFGARYYDSRIGRWGGVEPMLTKYFNISPYTYSINNPINTIDPNGKDPRRDQLGSINTIENFLVNNVGKSFWNLIKVFENAKDDDITIPHYIATSKQGFLDLKHVFAAAYFSNQIGIPLTLFLGEMKELTQYMDPYSDSDFDPEDPNSNLQGALLGRILTGVNITEQTIKEVINFMKIDLGILDPDDPSISASVLYIPSTGNELELPSRSIFGQNFYSPYRGEVFDYYNKYFERMNKNFNPWQKMEYNSGTN